MIPIQNPLHMNFKNSFPTMEPCECQELQISVFGTGSFEFIKGPLVFCQKLFRINPAHVFKFRGF